MQNIPQINLQQLTFTLPNGRVLFDNLSLTLSKRKAGLVGKNGIGKSTLIKLIMGELNPNQGSIHSRAKLAYVPQNPIFCSNMTIAEFLGYAEKINALNRIIDGSVEESNYEILAEDWQVKDRMQQELATFGLGHLSYDHPLRQLSAGEMTRLMLTKTFMSDADFLLLDEPTNHLDMTARIQLYKKIKQWQGGLLIISHDRKLLNLMDDMIELTSLGVNFYGVNYDAYQIQKQLEMEAKQQQLSEAKQFFVKTECSIQSSQEKHDQRAAKGLKQRRMGKIDKLSANAAQGRSEQSQRRLITQKEQMYAEAKQKLEQAKEAIEVSEGINIALPKTAVPHGKIILTIENISFCNSNSTKNIIENFSLKIRGPERIAISGPNGSGKTTLIKLILGELQPQQGQIEVGTNYVSYLDQNTSLLNPNLSLIENFMQLNPNVKHHDAHYALASFLFKNIAALKLVKDLSGGEKMRALLACILLSAHPSQLLILDEPTNHLDLQSIASIESILRNYQGALIVISHDEQFLENLAISRIIKAPFL